jgi:hypothetical protein
MDLFKKVSGIGRSDKPTGVPDYSLKGSMGESSGYKTKPTFGQKLNSLKHTIVGSRCAIIKLVLSMLIVTILLFIVKRYVFKVSKESPLMSDFALTFALVGVTLGLKAAAAIGLALFQPLKCPSADEKYLSLGWLPPPTKDEQRPAYIAYKAASASSVVKK